VLLGIRPVQIQDDRALLEHLELPLQDISQETARVEATEIIRNRLDSYQLALSIYERDREAGVQFKASTAKTDGRLTFLSTNLHIQRLEVLGDCETPSLYSHVTCGAFAAHSLGFAKGGTCFGKEKSPLT